MKTLEPYRPGTTAQIGAIYAPQQRVPEAVQQAVPEDPQALYNHILGLVNDHPDAPKLRESLCVELANQTKVPSQGARLQNTMGGKPSHLYVDRYLKSSPGATVIVTVTDPETREIYTLLGRKYIDPKRPEKGLGDYIAPGGYMEVPSPKGMRGKKKQYDQTLEHTARREFQEETGLNLKGIKLDVLGVDSDIRNNKEEKHSTNVIYSVGLTGKKAEFPAVEGGDDLATLEWVNSKHIVKDPSVGEQFANSNKSRYSVNGINIRDMHGSYLEKAVDNARDTLIADAHQTPAEPLPGADPQKWRDYVGQGRQNSPGGHHFLN